MSGEVSSKVSRKSNQRSEQEGEEEGEQTSEGENVCIYTSSQGATKHCCVII